jgi:hypothetical protein
LTYRLDDDLRAKFNSEDCYLFGLGGAHFGGPLNCEAG